MLTPQWGEEERSAAQELVRLALAEDLGSAGDLTTAAVVPPEIQGRAKFIVRRSGTVAGLPLVSLVFAQVDPRTVVTFYVTDGTAVTAGTEIAEVAGPLAGILTGERTALNFLQRLSGIATLTRRYVDAIVGLPCQILDTRKTTPVLRRLEKYAVRCGGGRNHRFGLYDAVMIKDNHLAALGGTPQAVNAAVAAARAAYGTRVLIEVEVDTFPLLEVALAAGPDVILLDNMDVGMLRAAVERRRAAAPQVLLEASGGINLESVRSVAETGVDYVSIGALTHSAPALDIALDFVL
jgi:nicotinate-nucleotide pyrophosphorylase (carboxylating)